MCKIEREETDRLHKKRANELDGITWLKYSVSVWDDIKKTREEWELNHPAMFPMELPKRLIEIFTNKDQNKILDPFVGTGSTLLACKLLGKEGYGFDISAEYVKLTKKRIRGVYFQQKMGEKLKIEPNQHVYLMDARKISTVIDKESIDFCVTSPPYWDILKQKRTADYKEIKNYDQKKENIGEISDYKAFLKELEKCFIEVYKVLKKGAYCVIVVMDIRKKDKFYAFHIDIINFMTKIGFILDDIIIWNRKNEYSNLRPLGYPFVFRINKIHEFILIFKKNG